MNVCSYCDYPTNDYTWKRQRIICRRCWELECHDEVMKSSSPGNRNSGEEE